MDIKQAREKIANISKGTAIKHPKVLIAELCSVINFLIDELQQNDKPNIVVTPQKSLQELMKDKEYGDENFVKPPVALPWFDPDQPKYGGGKPKKRMGNAGDAE